MNAQQQSRNANAQRPTVKVAGWVDRLGGWIERHQRLSIALGNWETGLLADRLRNTAPDNPIYIAGLARSGSTILLELLSRHPDLATHRYRDFPPVFTPWLWNWFVDRAATAPERPAERAHKDRLVVTAESPEAFEEPLWMAFFPHLHNGGNETLDRSTVNPAFERFYRDHMRKLLLVRGGSRYLAKANYNVTRLAYLLKLFPQARFVVPIRDPVWHVASLMKQHALFCREQNNDPRIVDHLRRTGHFEFGPGRRAVRIDEGGAAEVVESLWARGEEVAGWAELWNGIYGHVNDLLSSDAALRSAVMVVRYEDLCARPRRTVADIIEHCGITDETLPALAEKRLSAPTYYQPDFGDDQRREILRRTAGTARAFGYDSPRRQTNARAPDALVEGAGR